MTALQFGTKAENLHALAKKLTSAQIKPLLCFTVAEWTASKQKILKTVATKFQADTVIIRSSTQCEDSNEQSMAGAFTSVPNIQPTDQAALGSAIEEVIESYRHTPNPENQVFVQEQVTDIKLSGVLFTRTADTDAPYYVFNYDDQGDTFDTVTSGQSNSLKTFLYYRNATQPIAHPDLQALLVCTKELEALFGIDNLDIEFAVTRASELFILQVRPIVRNTQSSKLGDHDFTNWLSRLHRKIQKLNQPHPAIDGQKVMYSVMTDWNPAEMIGIKPRALALSLYKELITDSIWAYQRDNYGYRNLRSFPLMVSFLGCPYIDVRVSFNSFVPKTLNEKLSAKLVDYYMTKLADTPTDHDKVEFKILYSCYYLNLSSKLKELLNFDFSELELDRIKFALLTLTNNILCPKEGLYKKDLERVEQLDKRFQQVIQSDLQTIDKLYWLVEDCKRYGTLPFAGLARAGFMAVQFLHSFVDLGIMELGDVDRFMNSLNTIAKQMTTDFAKLQRGELSQADFLDIYGHLRPGTYDIMSLRYDEGFERYFDFTNTTPFNGSHEHFEFSAQQKQYISELLIENGIQANADQLLNFIKLAIEGREYCKFLFTRSLSHILSLLVEQGEMYGISREDMSHVNIQNILRLYSEFTHHNVSEILAHDIENNKRSHQVAEQIKLPQLITHEDQIYQFHVGESEPNYVTLDTVTTEIVIEDDIESDSLKDKIVLVRSADPGYDWLFSRNIAGLVTQYGGANSHMAIRCAELQIPAVIGCGEKNFEMWSKSKVLALDCANQQVKIIS